MEGKPANFGFHPIDIVQKTKLQIKVISLLEYTLSIEKQKTC